jgi:hypothetical protein
MVPLREGKIADAEVPLIHDLHINAESAEQGESLGEQHATSLSQLLIVVYRWAQIKRDFAFCPRGIGNGPLREG